MSTLPVGRVRGHRGLKGEITVTVPAGDADHWVGVKRFLLGQPGTTPERYDVEASRAYGNRLVLKLVGIEDADRAAGFRGMNVLVTSDLAPPLAEDEHYRAELLGMEVVTMDGLPIGNVEDVWPTGASDLLVVRAAEADRHEIYIPLNKEIVPEIDRQARRIRVDPPNGLLDLNRSDEPATGDAEGGR